MKTFFPNRVVFIFFLSFCSKIIGHGNLITTGLGIAELFNVGVRFQVIPIKIGLNIGAFQKGNSQVLSFAGGLFFHPGYNENRSELTPWYVKVGLTYTYGKKINGEFYYENKYSFLDFRLGREIYFSQRVGMYVDLGLNFEIFHREKNNYPPPTEPVCCQGGPPEFPIFPAGGIGLFYAF